MAIDVSVDNNFNCHACDKNLKWERGCDGPGIIQYSFDGQIVDRCPVKIISEVSLEYLRAYVFYDKSILPNGNGWLNESYKFNQAMSIIQNEVKKIESKKSEK